MEIFDQWESEIRGYCRAYPTVFASASNAIQVDEQGKSYIDFFAGAGVLNFGHNNPHMKKAIIKFIEADGVAHSLDMATTSKQDFIQAFAETILKPRDMQYKMQFMGPTGTNAVEAALKLARRVTGRTEVVAFSQGFHGMTLGSLACTANRYFRNAAGVPLNNVTHVPFEGKDAKTSLKDLRATFENPSSGCDQPAAFIVETIQAEGGVRIASQEWLQGVQTLAHDLGALFIIDEIQVGCGRTGSYFSFDGMNLVPDIVCLAKGIGGYGTPLAMNLVKPEHDRHWMPGEHTGTFRGQGISFVAGREGLRYFENDELNQQTRAREKHINEHLKALAAQGDFKYRGKGMIHGLDVGNGDLAKAIARECFDNGLLIGPCGVSGSVIKLIPPLTIGDKELNRGLQLLGEAVNKKMEVAA
jgi:diaminobutyrate-2-oxoglutarate transaminase